MSAREAPLRRGQGLGPEGSSQGGGCQVRHAKTQGQKGLGMFWSCQAAIVARWVEKGVGGQV